MVDALGEGVDGVGGRRRGVRAARRRRVCRVRAGAGRPAAAGAGRACPSSMRRRCRRSCARCGRTSSSPPTSSPARRCSCTAGRRASGRWRSSWRARSGARVAVTAGSAAKLEACRELGAEVLVNYREEDFVERLAEATGRPRRRRHPRHHRREVPVPQRLCAGHQRSARHHRHAGRHPWRARHRGADGASGRPSSRPSLRARPAAEKATIVAAVREHVWPLVASGRVRPIVHSRHPLADAAAAHRELEAGAHVGKVLLTT